MTVATSQGAQLPRPGDMIAGKYVLDRLLGQGGMGAVFAAKHVKLSKAVAIKIMLADASNPEAAQRFINEGRAAANIQNEHVVRVDDVDEELGYAYMVLELLDGEDLAQVLEREPARRLAPHVAVGYVLQALRGVAQAHAIGIVHRDLKPSNLFLARRKDGSVVVKVLDFGISKAQGSSALAASPSALTSTKAMLGSPLYMSPEQLRSSKSVDQRADIWAIGVILYELISGSLPFMGENLGELFAAILETDPLPLRQRAENVPPGLDEVVLRCLARKPEGRFQSAAELANALAPFSADGVAYPLMQTQALLQAPPRAIPMGGATTPSSGQTLLQPQASGRPNVPGPGLGVVTPQGLQQTGSGWQSTGGGPAITVPKSKTPLIAGLAISGLFVVVGVVLGVLSLGAKTSSGADKTTASSSAAASSSSAVLASPPPPSADPLPPPSASVAVAATAPPPPSPPSPSPRRPPPSPKPADAKPADTPAPAVKPAPAPTPKNGAPLETR